MPVIAVAEVAYGISAIAAGVEGFAAVAAIGAIVAGVGSLTGDADMAKMGGAMGLVGGIGAVASNQSLWPQGSDTAVRPTEVGAAEATEAASAAAPEAAAVPIDTGAPNVPAEVAKTVPAAQPAEGALIGSADATGEAAKGIADAYQNTFDNGAMKAILDTPKPELGVLDTLKTQADRLMGWAKDNQLLASGMMQVGGKFMEGLFDPTKPAQTAYLQARADSERAQAGLLNQQLSTMQAPLPNAVSTGTRPASPFLGGSRPVYTPPKINVTGAPA